MGVLTEHLFLINVHGVLQRMDAVTENPGNTSP